jgi:PLP dependent protein
VSLAENLHSIQQRIQTACTRAGRDATSVTLLAVSKTHPPETVNEAVEAGQLFFGENKIQEAKAKIPQSPGRARWHFIGHLQSNKCRDAVELFEMIQSVDSLALAQEINKRAEAAAKTMPVLLEVNVAGEASKFGYPQTHLGAPLPHLSMGMSGDFEVAIEEGATFVRVGTALFGDRPKAKAL